MRSRYSAFALGDVDYLLRTWHPRTRPAGLHLDPRHAYVGLEVRGVEAGGADDAEGRVTYRVRSRASDGRVGSFTEDARFARRGRRWVYVDGTIDPAR